MSLFYSPSNKLFITKILEINWQKKYNHEGSKRKFLCSWTAIMNDVVIVLLFNYLTITQLLCYYGFLYVFLLFLIKFCLLIMTALFAPESLLYEQASRPHFKLKFYKTLSIAIVSNKDVFKNYHLERTQNYYNKLINVYPECFVSVVWKFLLKCNF